MSQTIRQGAGAAYILARPCVLFYLAGRIEARRLADGDSLGELVGTSWLLLDEAQLRQDGSPDLILTRLQERWEVVDRQPTRLNLPTWLDVDPSATAGTSPARDSALILLRPRSSGGTP
jgi:hypothetical protein